MHPCDRLEQPGQGDVAICSLLRDEAVEKRAPRGVDLAQRGMNASDNSEGTRERVREAEFAIGCRGAFRVWERGLCLAHCAEHGGMYFGCMRSAILIVQRAKN